MKPRLLLLFLFLLLLFLSPTLLVYGAVFTAFFCVFLLGGVSTCCLSVMARRHKKKERSFQKDWRKK